MFSESSASLRIHPLTARFKPRSLNTEYWILNTLVLLLLGFLALTLPAHAQQVAISANFEPNPCPAGQQAEYRVVIIANQRVQELPNMVPPDGIQFIPNGSQSEEVNGQIKSTIRYIVPTTSTGLFLVRPFDVEVDGQKLRVPPSRLVVNGPGLGGPGIQIIPGNPPPAQGFTPMRVVLDIPPRDYYVGESIQARLLFIASDDEIPTFVQHIAKTSGTVLFKPSRNYLTRPGEFTYNGQQVRGLSMNVEIVPLSEGDSALNCEASVQVQRTDGFGHRSGFASASTVQSQTANIHVVALPKVGRPEGFTGAIGQFSLGQPKLSAKEIEAGEPLMLSFAVSGNGNIDAVPAPPLREDAQWRAYKPTSEFDKDDDSGKATKTFTYTLVARAAGQRSTPPIPFSYFDPAKHSYVDITIPPMAVNVKAATGATAAPAEATVAEAAPAGPPPEPEPILTGLAETSGYWTRKLGPDFRVFFYAQLMPPVLLFIAWLWRRRRDYLAAHPEIPLRRRSRAAARRALSEARSAANRDDVPAFLRAGTGALCEAATRYHGATAGSLTPGEVLQHLEGDAAVAARTIFEHSDANRYASSASAPPRPASLLSGLERAVATLSAQP